MFERDRARELRQPEVRSDKHIVHDLFDVIRWYPPTDDADDVALVSVDKVCKSVNLPATNTLEEIPIVWFALENR
jgi:hypothetical protein